MKKEKGPAAAGLRQRTNYRLLRASASGAGCTGRSGPTASAALRRSSARRTATGRSGTAARRAGGCARLLARVLRGGRMLFARELAVVVLVELREVLGVRRVFRLF